MRNSTSWLRSQSQDVPAATSEPLLVITGEKGRESFHAWAQRGLRQGEALVAVKDLVGVRRAMRTTPRDSRARLVATESPTLLRGALTALVSYYVVPLDALDAVERHFESGEESHAYEVVMRVVCVGRAPGPVAVA